MRVDVAGDRDHFKRPVGQRRIEASLLLRIVVGDFLHHVVGNPGTEREAALIERDLTEGFVTKEGMRQSQGGE